MPGFTTHYLFGVDVYHSIPNCDLKKIIRTYPSAYKLGLQGPDIFFFYLPCLLGNQSKNLGSAMHQSNVNKFFENYLTALDSYSGKTREIGISYLAGFLCHYGLDALAHPFIYSRTDKEIYNVGAILRDDHSVSQDIKTLYYADHRILETIIDTLMLKKRKNLVPSKFLKDQIVRMPKEVSDTLSFLLCNSINSTYYNCCTLSPRNLHRVFHAMKRECKILANRTTKKKQLVERIENRYIKFPLLSSLIPSDFVADEDDALNLSHHTWSLPWEPNCTFSASFLDLYKDAIEQCRMNLVMLDNYLKMPASSLSQYICKNILLQKLGNRSYHTGEPLSETPAVKMYISPVQYQLQ